MAKPIKILLIAGLLISLMLVAFKSVSKVTFRNNAVKWSGASLDQSNLVTGVMLQELPGEPLLVSLDINEPVMGKIPAEELFKKENIKTIRKHKGSIVLFSTDRAKAAKTWMVLSQMGYKNLYLFSDTLPVEVFKHKFRPDSATRPELKN
ncbi:MAG: hypothetical protein JXQ80_03675 [Bacteroidales bacterium]|nr:hypothetical protein [Bacteroidales bacterium]